MGRTNKKEMYGTYKYTKEKKRRGGKYLKSINWVWYVSDKYPFQEHGTKQTQKLEKYSKRFNSVTHKWQMGSHWNWNIKTNKQMVWCLLYHTFGSRCRNTIVLLGFKNLCVKYYSYWKQILSCSFIKLRKTYSAKEVLIHIF